MTLVSRYIKANNPGATVVFIGPCIAKKLEAKKVEDTADYVITLRSWQRSLRPRGSTYTRLRENEQDGSRLGKGFAQSGGVAASVAAVLDDENFEMPFSCIKCNGAKECKKTLMIMNANRLQEDIVEGMACEGGCVAGPGGVESMQKLLKNRAKLLATADKRGIKENIEEIHDFPRSIWWFHTMCDPLPGKRFWKGSGVCMSRCKLG